MNKSKKSLTMKKDSSIMNRTRVRSKKKTVKNKAKFIGGGVWSSKFQKKRKLWVTKISKTYMAYKLAIVKRAKKNKKLVRILKQLDDFETDAMSQIKKNRDFLKPLAFVSVGLILFSAVAPLMVDWVQSRKYVLNERASKYILEEPSAYFGAFIQEDHIEGKYLYNADYAPSQLGGGATPEFIASFDYDSKEGYTITDPVNSVTITMKPKYDLKKPQLDENRIIYPLRGMEGAKVLTVDGFQVKEDIILDEYQGDSFNFEYELEMPVGVVPKMENDGSISFYGVESLLLGNVTTSSPADEALLESARANGEKTNLLFRIPAPVVYEEGRTRSMASARYHLAGNTITLIASELDKANYPISVDPSIYIETARKLMRGNNETNVDFDASNELIKKSFTTGARFDEWTTTMDLNDGRWNQGTATAGGFIYAVGGEKVASTTTTYTTAGSDTFVVPAGVTSITVKVWGAGGGGGGAGTAGDDGDGGAGGGGGFAQATLAVTPAESLNVIVGGGGGEGDFSTGGAGSNSGDGGGGGGHSEVNRSGTNLIQGGGGGGGGGGDNSSSTNGGAGGAGGGASGQAGGASSSAPGGGEGTTGSGGAGGNGSENDGDAGAAESGGDGADGATDNSGSDGSKANGGSNGGGPGGNGDEDDSGFGAGGGGGSGRYGGGGGSSSIASNAGGGGGGGGSSYVTGTSTTETVGSATVPGNDSDGDRGGAGDGGSGGLAAQGSGTAGDDGIVVITYTGTGSGPRADVYWAQLSTTDNSIESPNPGAGTCTDWCTNSEYDLPDERTGFSLVAYNGFLYAIGGEDDSGTRQNTVYISKLGVNGEPSLWHPTDPDKPDWVYWYPSTNTLTNATSYGSAVAYNNRLYYTGGQTVASSGGVNAVYSAAFDPTGDIEAWSTTGMVVLPSVRHMHTLHVYNDTMYLLGGNSSGTLQSSVYYSKIDNDGDLNTWQSTDSFTTARSTWGGNFSLIWGAYIYLAGGCSAVNGSGYCTTIQDDIQLISINADGSLDRWTDVANVTNQRIGYGFVAWDNGVYRIGGCSSQNSSSGECDTLTNSEEYGIINPAGEVSTVSISEASGVAPCSGGSPQDCDMPPVGDDAGEGGQLLVMSVILNGYLYIIGGCTDYTCEGTNPGSDDADISGNVSYVEIGSDGSMQAPSSCGGTSYGAWCVDSTNRINGTTGIAAAGVTVFNDTIYIVGGLEGGSTSDDISEDIFYNTVNTDGSLSGAWSSVDMTSVGMTIDIAYTYAYARANPATAGTTPGHLFIFGGCANITAGISCGTAAANYRTEVYKCNIGTSGAVSSCSTSGQTQIDSDPDTGGNQGLGIHSGTVNANYIYLIGGYSNTEADKDEILIGKFDDSNNVVEQDGAGTADWSESANTLSIGRRRGWGFGYNGHIYSVGGYDAGGGGTIPFIEWSKMDVSDGSIDPFVTSAVTINQRWGLSMAVSNSYAYVLGGCDVGTSPTGCSSYEPSIQVFELYNNDSGSVDDFTAQGDQTFAADTDRWGASSVIHNGYIYVAAGCTSATDCTTVTDNVQYAPISAADGTIGTWSSTTMTLPQDRGWGELLEAGGTLYWVGGEDAAGDEKSDVYFATPETAGSAEDVFRSTTYKLAASEFTGTTYTLSLNNDLAQNYFVMIAGASANSSGDNGPDDNQIRVSDDPFANIGTATAADELDFERGGSGNDWVGSITVVECLLACDTEGFQLKEIIDGNLPNTDVSEDFTLSEDHGTNTVPFGGYRGGGLSTAEGDATDFVATAGVRVHKNSTNQIRVDRDASDGNASDADISIYVVDWGSNWTIQEADVAAWTNGGDGVDASGEYSTAAITTVNRDETWLWKSPGTGSNDGLGNGSFGTVLALGDGTTTQNATESTVAVGSRRNNSKNDTVYVMEHSSLAVDYRFTTQASHGTSLDVTVDSATTSETVNTVGNVTSSEGLRAAFHSISDSGQGLNYTKVAGWSHYYSADGTLSTAKSWSGNDQALWTISADFAGITYTPTNGDLALWETASNGIGADRTRFGAAEWNDRLYIVGGLDDSASETNTVYISPQQSSGGDITSAWTTSTTFDVARQGHAVTAYANNLYVFGGYDGTNYLVDSQFTQINSDGTVDAWTFTTSLTGPLRDSRAFAANGYIYLMGGRTAASACTPKTRVVPIVANTTIATGNNPTGVGEWYETNIRYGGGRYGAAVAYDEGKIYTMGGGCTMPLGASYTTGTISQTGTTITGSGTNWTDDFIGTTITYQDLSTATITSVNSTTSLVVDVSKTVTAGTTYSIDPDRHYESTVNSQPQVAKYSRLIDTDTDVFPNKFLMNGIDNSIGARWEVKYTSSTDATSAWGQETEFGEVTLGTVNDYTPLDGAGADTEFARFIFFWIEIDASQTFGYPDDVNRGPTINDITLFFTADPSKRLRHGKTFTGGEKQPLDTPPGP